MAGIYILYDFGTRKSTFFDNFYKIFHWKRQRSDSFQRGFTPLNPTKGGHALLLNPPKIAMRSECERQRSARVPTNADASAGRRANRRT